jgi:hypothetical protein
MHQYFLIAKEGECNSRYIVSIPKNKEKGAAFSSLYFFVI